VSNFKTDVKGSVVLLYKDDNLQKPVATVNSADDVEDMRGQIREAVMAAYHIGVMEGYRDAKSEPLRDDPRVIRALQRAKKAGREQHAAQFRALLNEGLNKGKKNEKTSDNSDL
jgi:hypothetical protein